MCLSAFPWLNYNHLRAAVNGKAVSRMTPCCNQRDGRWMQDERDKLKWTFAAFEDCDFDNLEAQDPNSVQLAMLCRSLFAV